jgi:multimeric flavodoxin WrbA
MFQNDQLSALFINCSIKKDSSDSHTQRLLDLSAGVMKKEGVQVETVYALDHEIAFGMVKDAREQGLTDDWPSLQQKVMAADILVLGTPIWLGAKSSVASLVIERLYAYSGETNSKGQYLYYGKTAGCATTGNEDGAKHCAMDMLYALQHIGYTIPPQADFAWLGEIGPGPSYGDTSFGDQQIDPPAGYDSDFTNRNTTIASWNLMHMARQLKQSGGIPDIGNTSEHWRDVSHADPLGEQ